jgi:hypothetical protein
LNHAEKWVKLFGLKTGSAHDIALGTAAGYFSIAALYYTESAVHELIITLMVAVVK